MEERRVDAHEIPSSLVPSQRPSHLTSETYKTLVRILSLCYGQSEVSLTTPISPKSDCRIEATPSGCKDHGQQLRSFLASGCKQPEHALLGRVNNVAEGFSDTQFCQEGLVLSQIDDMMQVSELEDARNQKDWANHIITNMNGNQGGVADRQQMLMNDLELIMTGSEEATTSNGVLQSNIAVLDGEIEEGEISGDFLDDEPADAFVRGPLFMELEGGDNAPVKAVEKEMSVQNERVGASDGDFKFYPLGSDLSTRRGLMVAPEKVLYGVSEATEIAVSFRKTEVEDSGRLPSTCGEVSVQETLATSDNGDKKIASEGKTHAELSSGKKRRTLSTEAKAKKKQKERKKRAKERRRLGVKRLKLRPVLKQKAVEYCRHFLKGRCHEGEKCKFSHDTVPLTKSTPCCYFARQECMKGYDCPFDHDLSKYPCYKYETSGFCNRGDNCMFSHKVPLKDKLASPVDASKSEMEPPTLSKISHAEQLPNSTSAHTNAATEVPTLPDSSRNSNRENLSKITSPLSRDLLNKNGDKGTQVKRNANVTSTTKHFAPMPKVSSYCTFGKALPGDWNGRVSAVSPKTVGVGAKSLPLKDSTLKKHTILERSTANHCRPIKNVLQSKAGSYEGVNGSPGLSEVIPKGMSFLSVGTDLVCERRYGKDTTVGAACKDQNCSPKSEGIASRFSKNPLKGMTSSAQETLKSALAFAARIECLSPGKNIGTDRGNERQNGNDAETLKSKSKKIYEFLSSFSDEKKGMEEA